MGSNDDIIPYLFLVTFILAIAFGVWQYRRARKAKENHHTSADAKVHGDAPSSVGSVAPGRDRDRSR